MRWIEQDRLEARRQTRTGIIELCLMIPSYIFGFFAIGAFLLLAGLWLQSTKESIDQISFAINAERFNKRGYIRCGKDGIEAGNFDIDQTRMKIPDGELLINLNSRWCQ